MTIQPLEIEGLFVIKPKRHEDARGFFMEVYTDEVLRNSGVYDRSFVQENHSYSKKGVLRGLHFQWDQPLGKLIRVINGSAFVVAVDIRFNSATRGKWVGRELSSSNQEQLFLPAGFASGFCVTGEVAEVEYHYTVPYNSKGEGCIRHDDVDIGVVWPIENPQISDRDKAGMSLKDWLEKVEAQTL